MTSVDDMSREDFPVAASASVLSARLHAQPRFTPEPHDPWHSSGGREGLGAPVPQTQKRGLREGAEGEEKQQEDSVPSI